MDYRPLDALLKTAFVLLSFSLHSPSKKRSMWSSVPPLPSLGFCFTFLHVTSSHLGYSYTTLIPFFQNLHTLCPHVITHLVGDRTSTKDSKHRPIHLKLLTHRVRRKVFDFCINGPIHSACTVVSLPVMPLIQMIYLPNENHPRERNL